MSNLIKDIVAFSKKKKQSKIFIEFVEIFYLQNQQRDFKGYLTEELYELALQAFEFFKSGKALPKVRLISQEKSGFEYNLLEINVDDKPFLVDSIVTQIEKHGASILNIVHPIYAVERDKKGVLIGLDNSSESTMQKESLIQVHLDGYISQEDGKKLVLDTEKLLEAISLVVDDWKKNVALTEEIKEQISYSKKNEKYIEEVKEFITWLVEKGFIFLGMKEFDYKKSGSKYEMVSVHGSGLGVFRSKYADFCPKVANSSSQEIADSIEKPYILEVLKSSYKSQIHRMTSAERIRVQKFSKKGEVIGEYRLIGLFTSAAYYQSSSSIPLIRGKISKVVEKSNFIKGSHNFKDLISVLEDYPRDELFQIDIDDLLRISSGIVMICGRNRIKLFSRKDKFGRFISCLVFMPKEHSNSEMREKIRNYLAEVYEGNIADSFVQITESSLVRLHVIIEVKNPQLALNEEKIENEITQLVKPWNEGLKEEIALKFGEEKVAEIFAKYENAFSVSYTNRFDGRRAAIDISRVDECLEKNKVVYNLYKSSAVEGKIVELKIYSPQKELILSEVMPTLESFGLNVIHEHTYIVSLNKKSKVWIHYFRLHLDKTGDFEFSEDLKLRFEEAISLISVDIFSIGSLNRLLVSSNLGWKQIYMLRAYAKYIYQAGYRYDQEYVSNILVKYDNIVKLLIDLFEAKFNPALKLTREKRDDKIVKIIANIESELHKVSDASHDIVIRKFFSVIDATLRTNYYQVGENGEFKGYVSFKFDCKKIPGLPLPLPYAEIFVHSNFMEGVHLRGGKVARGGLRWSDRQEDFRTEVMGLVKAQMTKNAVIVPVGSKGGFVLKKDTSSFSREEFLAEGIRCYKTFLRGLLDLTDNIVDGKIVYPKNTILHDKADPYLVVAADKGTATFSDIANSVSAEYGFWLGDAFASGGSVGYDHKKMGITAKGAWVSVQRHFHEMGVNTQKEDFTCVGIGDMAGDVFGNGMLLSKHIKLVAAFNHMHIFLDPNPDAASSFKERKRLFNLPRSSWMDYDKSLISKGGGIFERSAKSIKISQEIQEILQIEESELTPNQLLTSILKAPVDLLWNGGIGTYVKATEESDTQVGDRANDAIRINGSDLRCKVVGEGGNLGFTQKGRIEYAINGGCINTDAMDNSAGVDCSDHEVNIKIALTAAMRANKITLPERNKVLESMTDEVAELVLDDNRLQTQAITIAQSQGLANLGTQGQFLTKLEKQGLLNREVEFLPSKKTLVKRQADRIGMTRPELCVMLAYSKMEIYSELLSSKLIDDKYFEEDLMKYFPALMQKKFSDEIKNHQLRREIIATQITNFVVNRAGITFINQISQETGFKISEVVKSFIIAADSFGLRIVWEEVEDLGVEVAHHIKSKMFLSANKLLERSVLWLLRNHQSGDLGTIVGKFKKIASELFNILPEVMAQDSRDSYNKKIEIYSLNNISEKLACKVAAMDPIASAFDIAEISAKSKFDLKTIARIYFVVGTRFSLKWLRTTLIEMPFDAYWQRLAAKTLIEDFYLYQMRIAKQVVDANCTKASCSIDAVGEWSSELGFLMERYDNFVIELKAATNVDMSMFVVALNRLKPLIK